MSEIMSQQMKSPKVVKVDTEGFELDDGRHFPHAIELDSDEIPTVEEFQAIFDKWRNVFANELKEQSDDGEIG